MDKIFKPYQRKWITPAIQLGAEAEKLHKLANKPFRGLRRGIAAPRGGLPAPSPHETREKTRTLEQQKQDIRNLVEAVLKPSDTAESMERVNESLANMAAARKEFDSMNIECSDEDDGEIGDDSEDDVNLYSTDDSIEDEEDEDEPPAAAAKCSGDGDGYSSYPPSARDLLQKIEKLRAKDEAESKQQPGDSAAGVAGAAPAPAPTSESYNDVLDERDKRHDAEFAVFYKYSENKAKERAKTSFWREKSYQQETFGMSDEKYFEMAARTSSTLAFNKHEVMADDPVTEGMEMPLLAGPIPHKAMRKLTTLALYGALSDEPGNFQWKSTHVMEQLTANQQAERQLMRKYQREGRRMTDERTWLPNESIVTVTFYQPSELATYDLKAASEPKPGLEIEILGSHTLQDLQKQFYCQRNYVCIKDCEQFKKWITIDEAMDRFEGDLAMNVVRGDCLYIHDTCYTDGSDVGHDHCMNVRNYIADAPNNEFEQYIEKKMDETKISDLTVRFGYPYMYLHQGDCEHIVVFNAIRIPRAVEFVTFPRYDILGKYTTKFCRIDKQYMARWIVTGSERFPEDPIYLCNSCVEDYCFTKPKEEDGKISGKKIGDFKLFPFLQITAFV